MSIAPDRWAAIRGVLDAALEVPRRRRAAFVTRACGEDDELRRDVERYLRAVDDAEELGFLADEAASLAVPVITPLVRSEMLADVVGDLAALETFKAVLADRYEIDDVVGRGGMAVVFRARDVRHKRPVAVKVMKVPAGGQRAVARFLQEIRIVASLTHPHILPLHDSGEAAEFLYYVTPFIEGETLRERLETEGRLPIGDVVRIAREVAAALSYAHRRGVVHRDVKPENVLIADGHAVVADFGIARVITEMAIVGDAPAAVFTTTDAMGTPAYMAPEQFTRAVPIDQRADLYALGTVMYEMLTGINPFRRDTPEEVLSAKLEMDYEPVSAHRDDVPESVARLVERLVEREPENRHASADEVSGELEAIGGSVRRTGAVRRRRLAVGAVTLALAGAATAWMWQGSGRPSPADGGTQATFVIDSQWSPASGRHVDVALSPDGRRIAYSGMTAAGRRQLFLRTLDDAPARPIPHTEDGEMPFFSPDGSMIGFVARQQLLRVSLAGGEPVAIIRAPRFYGAAWARPGMIVAAINDSLVAIETVDNDFRVLPPDPRGGSQRWPIVLGDASTIVYTSWLSAIENARLGTTGVDGVPARMLELAGTFPIGVTGDQLVYLSQNGSITTARFDAAQRRATAQPISVVDNVVLGAGGAASAQLSRGGTLLYASAIPRTHLTIVAPSGARRRLTAAPGRYWFPRASPDGRMIAFTVVSDSQSDIHVYDVARRESRALTHGGENGRPEWTPDGGRVIYSTRHGLRFGLWTVPPAGGKPDSLLMLPAGNILEGVMSPDGQLVVYRAAQNLFFARVGDSASHPVAATTAAEFGARLSPDGRWVAYSSDESGIVGVYVSPFPSLRTRHRVSDGTQPVWSRDGRTLYFRRGAAIVAAELELAPVVRARNAREVGRGDFVFQTVHAEFDVLDDGSLIVPQAVPSPVRATLVANWAAERAAAPPAPAPAASPSVSLRRGLVVVDAVRADSSTPRLRALAELVRQSTKTFLGGVKGARVGDSTPTGALPELRVSGQLHQVGADSVAATFTVVRHGADGSSATRPLPNVIAALSDRAALVENAQLHIGGAVAALLDARFPELHWSPPRYDAYLEYVKAVEAYVGTGAVQGQTLSNAARLDTAFASPWLILLELGPARLRDSATQWLGKRRSVLSARDRLLFDVLRAERAFDFDEAYRVARELRAVAPDDPGVLLAFARTALSTRRYRDAMAALHRMRGRAGWSTDLYARWHAELDAHHMLGDFRGAIAEWDEVRRRMGHQETACVLGVRQFAAAGDVVGVDTLIERCVASDVAADRGRMGRRTMLEDELLRWAGREFAMHGHAAAARTALLRAFDIEREHARADSLANNGWLAAQLLRDWPRAYALMNAELARGGGGRCGDPDARAICSPRGRTRYAVTAAGAGDTSVAVETLRWFSARTFTDSGYKADRARVELALGRVDDAMRSLREALPYMFSAHMLHAQTDLLPLREDRRFRALFAPR